MLREKSLLRGISSGMNNCHLLEVITIVTIHDSEPIKKYGRLIFFSSEKTLPRSILERRTYKIAELTRTFTPAAKPFFILLSNRFLTHRLNKMVGLSQAMPAFNPYGMRALPSFRKEACLLDLFFLKDF
jgi:hypothetical protein